MLANVLFYKIVNLLSLVVNEVKKSGNTDFLNI